MQKTKPTEIANLKLYHKNQEKKGAGHYGFVTTNYNGPAPSGTPIVIGCSCHNQVDRNCRFPSSVDLLAQSSFLCKFEMNSFCRFTFNT